VAFNTPLSRVVQNMNSRILCEFFIQSLSRSLVHKQAVREWSTLIEALAGVLRRYYTHVTCGRTLVH